MLFLDLYEVFVDLLLDTRDQLNRLKSFTLIILLQLQERLGELSPLQM